MNCREYIENYGYIKEKRDIRDSSFFIANQERIRRKKRLENLKNLKECGDMLQYFNDNPDKFEAYKKRQNQRKKKKRHVEEQSSQMNSLSTVQRLSSQGNNSLLNKGFEYKITGQFKNAEAGSITNQEASNKENENPNLEISLHDYVLVELHGQKMTLKIESIIGNEYVGEDNDGKEYKFDKSQILKKINT